MRRSLVAAVVLVLAVAAGVVAAQAQTDPRTELAQALDRIPAETGTASFTDWSRVRATLGGDLDSGSRTSAEAFLSRAYGRDLSAVSVLSAGQPTMQEHLGWSVLDLEWEMYAQSGRGAVLVLALSPSTAASTVVDGLRDAGYTPPSGDPSEGGVWRTNDEVAVNAPGLPDQLANVAVLRDEGLVVASDRAPYAERTTRVVRGEVASFGDSRTAVDLAQPLYRPDVAVLRDARSGCASTSYSGAAEADQNRAEDVVGDSLEPHHGLAIAIREHDGVQRMQVAMRFSSVAEAQGQLPVRRRLATGDAIGQGGTFGERFGVTRTRAAGPVGLLDLRLVSPTTQAFSDLGEGPLLFAWCGPR